MVGSGSAGFATALAAKEAGLEPMIGGKAAKLAQLARAGLRVSAGFVIC